MPPTSLLDRDGTPAVFVSDTDGQVRGVLASGETVALPRSLVHLGDDGIYRADVSFEALAAGRETLLEVEERLSVRREVRETGRVVAQTVTETAEQPIDADGWRETVEVERVPVGRVVEAVEPPRTEGDTTVVPVYEEVLVIQKRLVLREEVRLVTRREPVPGPERVTLRRQRVEVERLPPSGD